MAVVKREIQRDIYATLSGDATLTALITGVFDHVPQSQIYPYVKIGSNTYNNNLDNLSTEGLEGLLTIDTWDRPGSRGVAPLHDIMDRIHCLLHCQLSIFNLTEFRVLDFRETLTTVIEDPDTVTMHGVSQYTIKLGGICLK